MKREISKRMGLRMPPDATPEEFEFADLLPDLVFDSIYGRLPTDRMRALVAMHFELGYDQVSLAKLWGVSQPAIAYEIEIIRQILKGKKHKPQKRKKGIDTNDLLKLIYHMTR